VVPEFFDKGVFTAQASLKTLANAMDVGNPSNFERVTHLFTSVSELKKHASAVSVSDDQIRGTIVHGYKRYGEIWCPHTAAAAFARVSQGTPHWIITATAHPAKFNDVLEPLLGKPALLPSSLESLMGRPVHSEELVPELGALMGALKRSGV
jgi:threonine synthase